MEKPGARTLEITVISGQHISMDQSPLTEEVYVVVRAESVNSYTTQMVKQNEGVIAWNEKFLLEIPTHAKSVTFEVQSNKYKDVRPIGVARIALLDFLSGSEPQNCLQMFNYELRDWCGRRNGVICFSVKLVTQEEEHMCVETKLAKGIVTVSSCRFENVEKKNSAWWNFLKLFPIFSRWI